MAVQKPSKWLEGKPPASIDEFYECVAASGVLGIADVRQLHESLPPEKQPKDPKGLATELVRAGKLTKYQALSLLQGKLKFLVFGEYLILEKLGKGGMGQVMKAEHRRMKRVVALKLFLGDALKDSDAIRRFHREVHAAARLIHPNIVTAFDASEHEGVHYYVMEYVEGLDLGALSKLHGPLPVAMAVDYVLQTARGLAYAHGKGVVHRDMKPGNLLVNRDGTVKILDMGLARIDHKEGRELTGSGLVLGTVDYMAAEQALDTHSANARSDIYSLGCTLYRLLTAELIYADDSMLKTLLAHREAPIPPLKAKRPDMSPVVEAIYQKMVAKRPEARQQTMAEVVAELESIMRPTSLSANADVGDGSQVREFLSIIDGLNSSGSVTLGSVSEFQAVTALAEPVTVAAPRTSEVTTKLSSSDTDPDPPPRPRTANAETPSSAANDSTAGLKRLPMTVVALVAAAALTLLIIAVVMFSRSFGDKAGPPAKPPEAVSNDNSPM